MAKEPLESSGRIPLESWWAVTVLLFYYVLSMVDRTIITMLVGPIQADLGLTDFEMSLLLGPAFAVVYSVGAIPLGWAADRYSRRGVIAAGVGVWSLATLCSGLSTSFGALFASRVGVGLGEASLGPSAYSLIADKFPRKRMTTAIAIYGMGPKLGTGVAFALGAAIIAYTATLGPVQAPVVGLLQPWQLTLLILGAPGVAFAMLAFTFREPPRKGLQIKSDEAKGAVWAYAKANAAVLAPLILGFSLVALANNALLNWTPTFMTRHFGWGPAHYGPIIATISLLSAWTVVIKGIAVDFLYARGVKDAHLRFYIWLLAAAAPALALAFIIDRPMSFLLLYGFANIAALSFTVYMGSILQIVVPVNLRGRVTGIALFCVTGVATGIAPMTVAALTDFVFKDQAAIGWSLGIVSVTALGSALLMFWSVLKRVRLLVESSLEAAGE
jgi:MFS family permease